MNKFAAAVTLAVSIAAAALITISVLLLFALLKPLEWIADRRRQS